MKSEFDRSLTRSYVLGQLTCPSPVWHRRARSASTCRRARDRQLCSADWSPIRARSPARHPRSPSRRSAGSLPVRSAPRHCRDQAQGRARDAPAQLRRRAAVRVADIDGHAPSFRISSRASASDDARFLPAQMPEGSMASPRLIATRRGCSPAAFCRRLRLHGRRSLTVPGGSARRRTTPLRSAESRRRVHPASGMV